MGVQAYFGSQLLLSQQDFSMQVTYSIVIMVLLLEFRNMDARTTRKRIYVNQKEGFVQNPKVCKYWRQGRCNRNPCGFLHYDPEVEPSQLKPTQTQVQKRPSSSSSDEDQKGNKRFTWTRNATAAVSTERATNPQGKIVKITKNEQPSIATITKKEQPSIATITKKEQPSIATITKKEQLSIATITKKEHPDSVAMSTKEQLDSFIKVTQKEQPDYISSVSQKKLCSYWAYGSCVRGDECIDLHSWFNCPGLSFLAKLEGHKEAVSGVVFPTGSDKLFSGSSDGITCVWDCKSGQCIYTGHSGCEIGCMISDGPWVYVGLENGVKALNLDTQTELHLSGPNGLVRSLTVDVGTLFGGIQDGSILVWEATAESSNPVVVATYKGHQLAVLSLFVGKGVIFSGSEDKTIRVWDRKTSDCLLVMNEHTASVTSVICWETYLISGSLDNSIMIWGNDENGNLIAVRKIEDESGVLALKGIYDKEKRPILLCSRTDNTVRLYELPSCTERGRVFTKGPVKTIAIETISAESSRLFFTGEATGQLGVWRLD